MLRPVLLMLIALLLICPAAQAARAPLPPVLTVHREPCPYTFDTLTGNRACASDTEIWVSKRADRFDYWHEIGHTFDAQVLTDPEREWFTTLLGLDPGPWVPEFDPSPDEYFADAFAACTLGLRPDRNWVDAYGYSPTAREHRLVCNGIAVLAILRGRLVKRSVAYSL